MFDDNKNNQPDALPADDTASSNQNSPINTFNSPPPPQSNPADDAFTATDTVTSDINEPQISTVGQPTVSDNPQEPASIITPTAPPDNENKFKGKKMVATIFAVLFLVGGVAAGVYLVQRQQNFSQRASGLPPASCPAGTQPLFNSQGSLKVGDSVALGGQVTFIEDSWDVDTEDGVVMAEGGEKVTVTFPNEVLLHSALIYDNDHDPGWTINGVSLPMTGNNEWGPLFNLNLTSNQMVFDNRGDSPHFNVCVQEKAPDLSASCSEVKAYDDEWNPLTMTQLSQLSAGETVKFVVTGTSTNGTIDKARFRVNSSQWQETTDLKPGESNTFYINYTIPDGVTSFTVNGQVHLQENDTWY